MWGAYAAGASQGRACAASVPTRQAPRGSAPTRRALLAEGRSCGEILHSWYTCMHAQWLEDYSTRVVCTKLYIHIFFFLFIISYNYLIFRLVIDLTVTDFNAKCTLTLKTCLYTSIFNCIVNKLIFVFRIMDKFINIEFIFLFINSILLMQFIHNSIIRN